MSAVGEEKLWYQDRVKNILEISASLSAFGWQLPSTWDILDFLLHSWFFPLVMDQTLALTLAQIQSADCNHLMGRDPAPFRGQRPALFTGSQGSLLGPWAATLSHLLDSCAWGTITVGNRSAGLHNRSQKCKIMVCTGLTSAVCVHSWHLSVCLISSRGHQSDWLRAPLHGYFA